MSKPFRPRPGDYGAHIVALNTPIASVTANTTNRFGLGSFNDKDDTSNSVTTHVAYVDEVLVGAYTVPADSDGTLLLSIIKYDASAAADVVLVTGTAASVSTGDLELLTAGKSERLTFDSGVTDAQRTMDTGDLLYVRIVNNSAAIDTQPVALVVTARCKLFV